MMILVLLFSSVVSAQTLTGCQPQYDNLSRAFEDVNQYVFPIEKFNTTCLAAACPALTSAPCPFLSGSTNQTHNITAVDQIVATFTSCLRDLTSLCDTPIQNIPICSAGITLQALLNNTAFNGTVSLVPGTGWVSGVPSASIRCNPVTNNGEVTINVTLVYRGEGKGTLGDVPFSGLAGSVAVDVSVTDLVNPADAQNPVRVLSGSVGTRAAFGGASQRGPDVQGLSQQLNLTTEASQQGLSVAYDVGMFYGTMLANVCMLTALNCK